MTIKNVHELVNEAKDGLDNLSPQEAQRRIDEEGALFVDIRDVRELQREGVAPGAKHAPRGMLEFWVSPDSPYHDADFAADREFILCCGGGWRSALAAVALKDMGLDRVSHIEPGFAGWKSEGMEIVNYADWKASRTA